MVKKYQFLQFYKPLFNLLNILTKLFYGTINKTTRENTTLGQDVGTSFEYCR